MAVLTLKSIGEKKYDFTDFEKKLLNQTALIPENIIYYEQMLNRKLNERELTIITVLINSDILLIETDFK